MLNAFENNMNPFNSINLHFAIRWLLRSWHHDVTDTTIYNCFRKSTMLRNPIQLPIQSLPALDNLYNQVRNSGQIHDAMDIANFLNPSEENIQGSGEQDQDQEALQEVLSHYTQDVEDPGAQDDDESSASLAACANNTVSFTSHTSSD